MSTSTDQRPDRWPWYIDTLNDGSQSAVIRDRAGNTVGVLFSLENAQRLLDALRRELADAPTS